MSFVTIVVLTALCLAFPPTRMYGVIGTGLLLYLYPLWTLGVLALAGIAFYLIKNH